MLGQSFFNSVYFSDFRDKNSSSTMKIDTLSFVYCLLLSHAPEVFHPHMSVLVPPVISAVGDSFYKITAEALLVLQQLVKVIRPLGLYLLFVHMCRVFCNLLNYKKYVNSLVISNNVNYYIETNFPIIVILLMCKFLPTNKSV